MSASVPNRFGHDGDGPPPLRDTMDGLPTHEGPAGVDTDRWESVERSELRNDDPTADDTAREVARSRVE